MRWTTPVKRDKASSCRFSAARALSLLGGPERSGCELGEFDEAVPKVFAVCISL